MSIFDRIKQKQNKNVDPSGSENSGNDISQVYSSLFIRFQTEVVKILKDVITGDQRYDENPLFDKCEKQLLSLFDIKYYPVDGRQVFAREFQKSAAFKEFSKFLNDNLNHYVRERKLYDFKGGDLNVVLKTIVDASITDNHPIHMQYARILLGNYYNRDYGSKIPAEMLYKNLINLLSYGEVIRWIKNDDSCFEFVIDKIIKRFDAYGIKSPDDDLIVKVFLKTYLFKNVAIKKTILKTSALNGKYSVIANQILGSLEDKNSKISKDSTTTIIKTPQPKEKKENKPSPQSSGVSEPVPKNIQPQFVKTVVNFANDQDWGEVYVYIWNDSTKAEVVPWPGAKAEIMGKDAEGHIAYTASMDAIQSDRIIFIFNNGKGAQTPNLNVTAKINGFKSDGSMYEFRQYSVPAKIETRKTNSVKPKAKAITDKTNDVRNGEFDFLDAWFSKYEGKKTTENEVSATLKSCEADIKNIDAVFEELQHLNLDLDY